MNVTNAHTNTRADVVRQTATARLAVCSWSLQPVSPEDLVSKLKQTDINRVQLALDPLRENPAVWGRAAAVLATAKVGIVSGMFGCVGEDYTTLDTIRQTGGIAPDGTWDENLKNIRATAVLAKSLGLKIVTFHAGFLPHEEADPSFKTMLARLTAVADIFYAEKILLGLETGQETAESLLRLLQELNRSSVGVNFDPANMVLYDKGDPIAAVRLLGPWVLQVHIKDGRRTRVPGTWGEEVPAGTGDVDWPEFFRALNEIGYAGDLVIEREAGNQRVADIITAKDLVASITP